MARGKELLALWESRTNSNVLTGRLGEQKVVAFKNTQKKNPKEPDWRVYEDVAETKAPTQGNLDGAEY